MWFLSIFPILVVLKGFSDCTAKYIQNTVETDENKIIYEKYIEFDRNLKNMMNSGIKMALPYALEASEHFNLSSSCTSNLFNLILGIKKLKLSPFKFLDAAGKVPPGLYTGTVVMFGDYDECLDTEVLRVDGKIAFQGQYCLIELKTILPKTKRKMTIKGGLEDMIEYTKNTSELMQYFLSYAQFGYFRPLKYGLCVPSGCSTDDITSILNYFGEKAFLNATVAYCDKQSDLRMHPGTIAAICFFSVAGLFAMVGSSMDYYSRKKGVHFEKKIPKILMCFSILSNFPKVISTKTQDKSLASIFGVRTLSLFFIILMHQYFYWGTILVHGHAKFFESQIPSFFFQIAVNGFLTTEVFFFLGGLLNTYSRMKIQDSGKRQLTALQIVIHRLWRIYPTYIFSMLTFYLFLNVRGPLATSVKQDFIETCDDKWWKNLLFINNFFDQDKICMAHTWYISVDMQMFLISLFTVPVLLKNAKKGIILHVGILIAGLVSTMLWVWYKDVMPSLLVYYLDVDDMQRVRNAYVTPLPHIAPYFTGLISGYILSKWNEFKIPKTYRLFGWPIAAAFFISMLFMTKKWNSGVEFSLIESALYFAFSRFLYVLTVAWLVVCCSRGYGGILNYILSLKIWIPFARISYMVYMISPLLQLYYYANLRMRIDCDYMTLIWIHIGDLGISCLMGLAMVVIVESPLISMEKLIFHRSPTKKGSSTNNMENTEKYINKDAFSNEIELQKNEKNLDGYFNEIELEKNEKNLNASVQLKE